MDLWDGACCSSSSGPELTTHTQLYRLYTKYPRIVQKPLSSLPPSGFEIGFVYFGETGIYRMRYPCCCMNLIKRPRWFIVNVGPGLISRAPIWKSWESTFSPKELQCPPTPNVLNWIQSFGVFPPTICVWQHSKNSSFRCEICDDLGVAPAMYPLAMEHIALENDSVSLSIHLLKMVIFHLLLIHPLYIYFLYRCFTHLCINDSSITAMLNSHCHVSSWKLTLAKVTERSYARMDGGSIFAKNVPGQKMKIRNRGWTITGSTFWTGMCI